jgi:hypothetical protein
VVSSSHSSELDLGLTEGYKKVTAAERTSRRPPNGGRFWGLGACRRSMLAVRAANYSSGTVYPTGDLAGSATPATSAARIAVRRRVAVIVDPTLDLSAEMNPKPPAPHSFFKVEPFAAARCFAAN